MTPLVSAGICFTVFGVTIYYILPYALMSFNLNLMGQIVVFILIGYLFGLVLLAYNFQSYLERALTHIFLIFERASLRSMVFKNLSTHRTRNQMTALIYSLSLGFLIFLSITSKMQVTINLFQQMKNQGAMFTVELD